MWPCSWALFPVFKVMYINKWGWVHTQPVWEAILYHTDCNLDLIVFKTFPMFNISYTCSHKIWWWGIKSGSLVVYLQLSSTIRQYFLLAYVHMVIPYMYQTAKIKSSNILTCSGNLGPICHSIPANISGYMIFTLHLS